jgi:heme A synthase
MTTAGTEAGQRRAARFAETKTGVGFLVAPRTLHVRRLSLTPGQAMVVAMQEREPSERRIASPRLARFAWAVLGFNLFVILWGAFVRATGSGAGCGSHWPLCNGQVVPRDPALATLIEFGHRVTSGIDLLLVAALVVAVWRTFPRRHPARLGAGLAAFFLVTEALIGAGLVLFEMVADNPSVARAFWMSGHLVNTYLLLAFLALTAWASTGKVPGVPPAALVVAIAGLLVLGVSGAVTALGDTIFPVASVAEARARDLPESADLFIQLRVWHPALAFAVGFVVVIAAWHAGRTGGTARSLAMAVIVLYGAQLLIGGVNWLLSAPVSLQLVHLLVSDLIWIALVLLAAEAASGRRDDAARAW